MSSKTQSALTRRNEARIAKAAQFKQKFEELNVKGVIAYNKGDFVEAMELFISSIEVGGYKALACSNLAGTLLKLKEWKKAVWAADLCLIADPKNSLGRTRRAMARTETMQWDLARRDLEIVLDHEPTLEPARNAFIKLERRMAKDDEAETARPVTTPEEKTVHYLSPAYDAEPFEFPYSSDTEDSHHEGNNVPCRFYNHQGCSRGRQCRYSHANDFKSIRDKLGKNVCIAYLLSVCDLTHCGYSHDRSYLPYPERWDFGRSLTEVQRMFRVVHDPNTAFSIDEFFHLICKFPACRVIAKEKILAQRKLRLVKMRQVGQNGAQADSTPQPMSKTSSSTNKPILNSTPNRLASPNAPLVIALLEDKDRFLKTHSAQLAAFRRQARWVHIVTNSTILELELQAGCARSIYLADGAILKPKYSELQSKLIAYARSGGHVVIGGLFPTSLSNISNKPLANAFFSAFGLTWRIGSTRCASYELISTSRVGRTNPSLPEAYSTASVNIQEIGDAAPIYTPYKDDQDYDYDSDASEASPFIEAPVVQDRIGQGSLAFVGDLDGKEETTLVLRAMFGLLDPQRVGPPPRKSKKFALFLSFGRMHFYMDDELYPQLLKSLATKLEVVSTLSTERMSELMDSPDLVAVFVPSSDIAEPNEEYLLSRLIAYSKSGGTVIFLQEFAATISCLECRPFFLDSFGLDWGVLSSSYNNSATMVNYRNALVKEKRELLPKGLEFYRAHAMYSSNPDDVVFMPKTSSGFYWNQERKSYGGPVLYARVGDGQKGRVVFVGDFEPEDRFIQLISGIIGV